MSHFTQKVDILKHTIFDTIWQSYYKNKMVHVFPTLYNITEETNKYNFISVWFLLCTLFNIGFHYFYWSSSAAQ